MSALPETEEGIDAFLAGFEDGTLPKERWTHGAHILGGACYVWTLGREAATATMRERVRRYNLAVGGQNTDTGGYHETITVMWIRLIDGLWQQVRPMPRAEFVWLAVKTFEPKRAIFAEYYDFDVVNSREARLGWVEPTLKALP